MLLLSRLSIETFEKITSNQFVLAEFLKLVGNLFGIILISTINTILFVVIIKIYFYRKDKPAFLLRIIRVLKRIFDMQLILLGLISLLAIGFLIWDTVRGIGSLSGWFLTLIFIAVLILAYKGKKKIFN
ncbi:hypothetical protein ACFLTH_03495 [Bacteroidota bacterium]